jgi:hypothetical protein
MKKILALLVATLVVAACVTQESAPDKPRLSQLAPPPHPADNPRSVAISGPYFHDGSVASLEEAVRFMAQGGKPDENRSPLLLDAKLSDRETAQLVAFLRSLTSDEPAVKPALP